MKRLPLSYPRRTVRIAVEHLLRHPIAIAERAQHDKIIILRAGKPYRVIMNHHYFDLLLNRAGLFDGTKLRRQWGRVSTKRQVRGPIGPLPD